MKRRWMMVLLAAALTGAAAQATAEQAPMGVSLERPWARASIGTSRPAAAYLTIINRGLEPARLVDITTPLAGRAEVHLTVKTDNVMRMEQVERLDVPPGGRVVFEPGGLHIMLLDLRQPLTKGGTLPLTLRFSGGGSIEASAPVFGPGARGPDR